MENQEFVRSYSRDMPRRREEGENITNLLQASREWSDSFGTVLFNYLQGEETTSKSSPLPTLIDTYESWTRHELSTLYNTITNNKPVDYQAINELNFHSLNQCMLPLWSGLLQDKKPITPKTVSTAQARLAMYGLDFFSIRQRYTSIENDYAFFTSISDDYRRTFNGSVTEVDMAITLLELTKQNPSLIVLPAPAQFEHSYRGSVNSDFVLIDTLNKQSRGIQVKTHVDKKDMETYDHSRVTLLDGAHDLDNQRAIRRTVGRSTISVVQWPGLIAAHHVKDINVREMQSEGYNIKTIMQRKMLAQKLIQNEKSSNKVAARLVSDRVLGDLYS